MHGDSNRQPVIKFTYSTNLIRSFYIPENHQKERKSDSLQNLQKNDSPEQRNKIKRRGEEGIEQEKKMKYITKNLFWTCFGLFSASDILIYTNHVSLMTHYS